MLDFIKNKLRLVWQSIRRNKLIFAFMIIVSTFGAVSNLLIVLPLVASLCLGLFIGPLATVLFIRLLDWIKHTGYVIPSDYINTYTTVHEQLYNGHSRQLRPTFVDALPRNMPDDLQEIILSYYSNDSFPMLSEPQQFKAVMQAIAPEDCCDYNNTNFSLKLLIELFAKGNELKAPHQVRNFELVIRKQFFLDLLALAFHNPAQYGEGNTPPSESEDHVNTVMKDTLITAAIFLNPIILGWVHHYVSTYVPEKTTDVISLQLTLIHYLQEHEHGHEASTLLDSIGPVTNPHTQQWLLEVEPTLLKQTSPAFVALYKQKLRLNVPNPEIQAEATSLHIAP